MAGCYEVCRFVANCYKACHFMASCLVKLVTSGAIRLVTSGAIRLVTSWPVVTKFLALWPACRFLVLASIQALELNNSC